MIAIVTAGNVSVHVPTTGELTLGEWRWVKRETGLNMFEFEEEFSKANPDTWWCLLAIGARREGLDESVLDGMNMLEVVSSVREQSESESAEGNAGSGEPPAGDESDVPAGPSPATIPDGSGAPHSPVTTVSTPG